MKISLPTDLDTILKPLFDELPLHAAMGQLVVTRGASPAHKALVEKLVKLPEVGANSALAAGLWLYVDELDRSHTISQNDSSPTGSYWHGIMHRREGDFSNSHYWFHRVGKHPAMSKLSNYDAHSFIDAVEERHHTAPADLMALQRAEWANLFAWCAQKE
ncbi:MAG: hypothetical protein HYV27_02640 [Candidatus Hydrogenedentes bacterium]|nr:hypothetical protein [Candidatus Hydrogenedentota bacterium]